MAHFDGRALGEETNEGLRSFRVLKTVYQNRMTGVIHSNENLLAVKAAPVCRFRK